METEERKNVAPLTDSARIGNECGADNHPDLRFGTPILARIVYCRFKRLSQMRRSTDGLTPAPPDDERQSR
jgi:hypothetical protein